MVNSWVNDPTQNFLLENRRYEILLRKVRQKSLSFPQTFYCSKHAEFLSLQPKEYTGYNNKGQIN